MKRKTKQPCPKCTHEAGPIGYISQYNHVQHGICFQCWGKGYVMGRHTPILQWFSVGAMRKSDNQLVPLA